MKLLEPQVLIIVLVIVLIIFGPKQLPELGKTLGKTMRSIREGMEDEPSDAAVASKAESTQARADDEASAE